MRTLLFQLLVFIGAASCEPVERAVSASAFEDFRIVSLHDTTTDILVGLGVADQLVALVEPLDLSPESAMAVGKVERLARGPYSAEAILALGATHLFGTETLGEAQPGFAPALSRAGIRVLLIDPRGLQGLWASILSIGSAVNRLQTAKEWVLRLKSDLASAAARHQSERSDPVRVFFYDCCDPPFTAGGRLPLTEILSKLGARNIFDDLDQDWARVSWESVIARKPELIVVHDYEYAGQGTLEEKLESLQRPPLAEQLPAIRAGALATIPLSLALEGPRTLEAIPLLEPLIEAVRRARSSEIQGSDEP